MALAIPDPDTYIPTMSVMRDFSRKLPRPVGGRLKTLADVRDHILKMENPSETWLHVGNHALAAADGKPMDDLMVALDIMRMHGAFRDDR